MTPHPADTVFIALLRAVNLGATRAIAMKDLAKLCTDLGLKNVRTFIQSGNVLFRTARKEDDVRSVLERALARHMNVKVDVFIRTASEMMEILDANPFPGC